MPKVAPFDAKTVVFDDNIDDNTGKMVAWLSTLSDEFALCGKVTGSVCYSEINDLVCGDKYIRAMETILPWALMVYRMGSRDLINLEVLHNAICPYHQLIDPEHGHRPNYIINCCGICKLVNSSQYGVFYNHGHNRNLNARALLQFTLRLDDNIEIVKKKQKEFIEGGCKKPTLLTD